METPPKKYYTYRDHENRSSVRNECVAIVTAWLQQKVPSIRPDDFSGAFAMGSHFRYVAYLASIGVAEYKELNYKFDPEQVRNDALEIITTQCEHCAITLPYHELAGFKQENVRHYYCWTCIDGKMVSCQNCGRGAIMDDPYIDLTLRSTGEVQWRCVLCRTKIDRASVPMRGYTTKRFGSGLGTKVQSARGWSTEIECYLTDPNEFAQRLKKLPSSFGIHRDGSLVNDGSRGENGNKQMTLDDGRVLKQGIEIQTPVLVGNEGEKYLIDLCRNLNAKDNAYVDNTCGLHIHIDMGDIYGNTAVIQKLLVFHWVFEPVLMSFLPANRRANIYCQSLKNDYQIKKLIETHSLSSLKMYWYKKTGRLDRYNKRHTRYHGINLHSLFDAGHMEVRYHSGTTNASKILNWVNLHIRIVDLCMGLLPTNPTLEQLLSTGLTTRHKPRSLSKLTRQMFEYLQMNDECAGYFKERQKKFSKSTTTFEAEFIEKEKQEIETEANDPNSLQLTLAEYMERLLLITTK